MRSLRRLSVISAASLSAIFALCAADARAQSASVPSAQLTPQKPAPFASVIPPLFSTGTTAPQPSSPLATLPPLSANTIHRLEAQNALKARKLSLLAQNNGPCYALRTYGFTPGHDPAEAPRLSSHTTCTPASKSHLRELIEAPSASSH